MACKRSPVRSRYSPPLAQIRVTNTVDFKSKSTVFLCLSASKFIAILQILCKIKVEVHMDLVSAINVYPADKLADNHLFCFKVGTIEIGHDHAVGFHLAGGVLEDGSAMNRRNLLADALSGSVQTCQLPLTANAAHVVTAVVVGGSAPEVGTGNLLRFI